MTGRAVTVGLTSLLFLASHGSVLADATSSPGKFAAYSSLSGVSIPGAGATVATVQISKGRKKRVLEVDVTAIDPSSVTEVIGIRATANGLAMEPTTFLQVEHSRDSVYNNFTAHALYWLDVDTAEAANPGMFVNVPINVDVVLYSGSTPSTGNVSVRARLVKK